jgi:hypothetical protein
VGVDRQNLEVSGAALPTHARLGSFGSIKRLWEEWKSTCMHLRGLILGG